MKGLFMSAEMQMQHVPRKRGPVKGSIWIWSSSWFLALPSALQPRLKASLCHRLFEWINKYSLKLQLSCTAKKEIFFFRLSFHEKLSIPVALSGLTHWRAKEIFACLDKHLQLPEGKGSASRFCFVVIVLCSEAPRMMPASSEHQRMGVCISNSPAQRRLCWHSHKYWGCDKKCQPGRWECVMRSYFGNWDHVGEHNNL